jgi:hypothetical protein
LSRKAISPSARGWIIACDGETQTRRVFHRVGQEAKVRLEHAEHVLHRLAGDADLLADHPLAVGLGGGAPACAR